MQAVDVRKVGYRVATGFFSRPKWLLRDVCFSVPVGGALALIGANGAGKTTLFKALLGALRPHTGEAYLWGRPAHLPAARACLGYMPERSPFVPTLCAFETLLMHARLCGLAGRAAREACDEGLAGVGLSQAARLRLSKFSKGMLQRLALAQALLNHPRLLVLDEPMSGLDPEGRLLLRDLLLGQRSRGVTLLFSSHALADVELLADTVVVMDAGRVVREGSTRSVLEGSGCGLEIVAYGDLTLADLQARLPRCRIRQHAQHTVCEVVDQTGADAAVDVIRHSGGHILGVTRRPLTGSEDSHA